MQKYKKRNTVKTGNISQEAAESILRRLCFKDFFNFGLVCSSWQDILANAVTNQQCYPLAQIPLLLLCPSTGNNNKVPCFFEADQKRSLRFENNICPKNHFVLGTINSWLIMAQATKADYFLWTNTKNTKNSLISFFFFFNPMSRTKVVLPSRMNDYDDILPKGHKNCDILISIHMIIALMTQFLWSVLLLLVELFSAK